MIKATAKRDINRAEYFINGNRIGISYNYPYGYSGNIDFLDNGFHNLSVKVCDDVENCQSNSVEFNLLLDKKTTPIDITTKITDPAPGTALSNVDFPLSITNRVNYPKPIASIECYYINENNEDMDIQYGKSNKLRSGRRI